MSEEWISLDELSGDDEEEPECSYCRGTGMSPHSIRPDAPCPYCGGSGVPRA